MPNNDVHTTSCARNRAHLIQAPLSRLLLPQRHEVDAPLAVLDSVLVHRRHDNASYERARAVSRPTDWIAVATGSKGKSERG